MLAARLLLVFSLLISFTAQASINLGVGMNSATGGRVVPALAGGLAFTNWSIQGSATGVQNKYYYHSSYTLMAFRTWPAGEFLWGKANAGVGLGAMYAKRGFRDDGDTSDTIRDDYAGGPAFQVRWYFADNFYVGFDVLLGLRDLWAHLLLNAQDVTTVSIGVSAW